MTDRTYMQLEILECPPWNVGTVIDLLNEHGFGPHTDLHDALPLNSLLVKEEASVGTLIYELAPRLAPLCSFSGWEDPKYEFPGAGVIHIRGLDEQTFTFLCFAEGQPVFTADEIRSAVANDRLSSLLGTEHLDRAADLAAQFEGVTLTRTTDDESETDQ